MNKYFALLVFGLLLSFTANSAHSDEHESDCIDTTFFKEQRRKKRNRDRIYKKNYQKKTHGSAVEMDHDESNQCNRSHDDFDHPDGPQLLEYESNAWQPNSQDLWHDSDHQNAQRYFKHRSTKHKKARPQQNRPKPSKETAPRVIQISQEPSITFPSFMGGFSHMCWF